MPRLDALQDPSLRLAVVETLSRAGKLDLGAVPTATNQHRTNPRTLNALLRVEVPARALAGITELWWEGGGQRLQHLVWPQWHGEDDTFYVHTLAGIDALAGLKKVTLASDADLLPLLELPALKSARLLLAGGQQRRSAAILTELAARGVTLTIENMDLVPRAAKRLTLPRG